MIVIHKIALAPNNKQAGLLSQHCGYARVARNKIIEWFRDALEKEEKFDVYAAMRDFNKMKYAEYEWCKALHQRAASNGMMDAADAIKRFRNPKLRAGFPRFLSRAQRQSYKAVGNRAEGKACYDSEARKLKLPKVGAINLRERVRFNGEISQVTISKRAGRWFAAVGVHVADPKIKARKGDVLGIDMGIKTLATCSDGTIYENPKNLDRWYRKLRRVDKAIARSRNRHGKTNRSNRRLKNYERRQKIYRKIDAIRDDLHHKATSALAMTDGVGKIVVETLNVAGMRRNRHLSRAFHQAGISTFLQMLEYKCARTGMDFEKADRWFASTKTCSGCGEKKVAMDLSEREYVCMSCGLVLDRDLNAARNLAQYGGQKNNEAGDRSDSKNGRGGTVRPASTGARPKKRSPGKNQFQMELDFRGPGKNPIILRSDRGNNKISQSQRARAGDGG